MPDFSQKRIRDRSNTSPMFLLAQRIISDFTPWEHSVESIIKGGSSTIAGSDSLKLGKHLIRKYLPDSLKEEGLPSAVEDFTKLLHSLHQDRHPSNPIAAKELYNAIGMVLDACKSEPVAHIFSNQQARFVVSDPFANVRFPEDGTVGFDPYQQINIDMDKVYRQVQQQMMNDPHFRNMTNSIIRDSRRLAKIGGAFKYLTYSCVGLTISYLINANPLTMKAIGFVALCSLVTFAYHGVGLIRDNVNDFKRN